MRFYVSNRGNLITASTRAAIAIQSAAFSVMTVNAALQVWTRMQYARAVIASGPHHIDALAIATCVAQQQASAAAAEVALQ